MHRNLEKGWDEQEIDTIQTTALQQSARILRRVLGRDDTCRLSDSTEKRSDRNDVENSQIEQ